MPEELQNNNLTEDNAPEIQTIPPEFYGGIKKVLPKPSTPSVQSAPLVASVRSAPQPANTPVISAGTAPHAKFSPKLTVIISISAFVLVLAGIAYYYINQAQKIKARQNANIIPASLPTEQVIASLTPTSTAPLTEENIATTTVSSIQPLTGVIFPPKSYAQTIDSDNDGLTDVEEAIFVTDSLKPDSDSDGYIDGLEVVNLYNPLGFKPVRLIDSGTVNVYLNPVLGYSLYYPRAWTAQSLDTTSAHVLFSSGAGDYVEVVKVDNQPKLSVRDWYKGQSPGTDDSTLKSFATKDKAEGAFSPDGLTAYLPFGSDIYAISYNIGLKDQVSFLQTFMMMATSFKYPGVAEQQSEAAVLPSIAAPAAPEPAAQPSGTSSVQ